MRSRLPLTVPLRFRLEYAALRAAIMIARALPFEAAVGISGYLWFVFAPYLSRHRRADRHLAAMIPSYSAAERARILREMWRNLGQTFAESLLLDRLAAEPDRVAMDATCQTILRRTMDEGGIVVSLHLGNWEASVIPLAAAGARHAAVYRHVANPLANAYLLSSRSRYYGDGLFAKGDAAARALLRRARDGKSCGIMADLRDSSGFEVPLFGRPAPSTPFPAMLARQFNRPLFAVAVVRIGVARFRMEATEIAVEQTGDRNADIRAATARTQEVFEGWIRRWPEQWMWAHRRYERSLDGR
jgi:KDO2-lipid IV(A) lauroyltransferase